MVHLPCERASGARVKPWKLAQIARVRAAVAHLRQDPHVELCDCCRQDLDLIEEAADSVCADAWCSQVAKRCALAGSRPSTR